MRKEKRREGASSETLLLGMPFYCLPTSTFITFQHRPPLMTAACATCCVSAEPRSMPQLTYEHTVIAACGAQRQHCLQHQAG